MPRTERPPLRCLHCRQRFARKHGQGLFCCAEHAKAHGEQQSLNADALKQAGFAVDGNKFTKDGHTLTLEEVRHHGLVKALARHAADTARN